jgi:signal transduction histidine kinase
MQQFLHNSHLAIPPGEGHRGVEYKSLGASVTSHRKSVETMRNQFRFRIIDGLPAGAEKAASSDPASSCAGRSAANQLLDHLADDVMENPMSLVMEGFQARVNALLQDRARTGRKLHDDVLRPLFTMSLNLHAHRHTSTSGSLDGQCVWDESIATLKKVIRDTRKLIRGLEEAEAQESDLMSEFYSMINAYEALGGLQIELYIESHTLNLLTQEEKRELLTITREALNNCIRHAQATRATVKLHQSKSRVCLAILDNGIGFSSTETQSRGYGLSHMENRARRLGGKLHVRSQKGRGTTIIAEFALEPMLAPLRP